MACGSLGIAINALLQVQPSCVHGLLFPEGGLYSLLMPFAHPPVAGKNVKDHHEHLHEHHEHEREIRRERLQCFSQPASHVPAENRGDHEQLHEHYVNAPG